MSTPQFLAWLEGEIQLHDKGKVIPPERILQDRLDQSLRDKLGQKLRQNYWPNSTMRIR
ncbi:MAG: hypothetical protein NHB14_19060 [Desulfosporosinus sp.]|nr:hypothetical protein [Desulfosporosinus sp.]